MEEQKLSVMQLIKSTKEELVRTGYLSSTLKEIERVWRNFEEFAQNKEFKYFSMDIGRQFLKEKYNFSITSKLSNSDRDPLAQVCQNKVKLLYFNGI